MSEVLIIDGVEVVVETQTAFEVIDATEASDILEVQAQGPIGPQGPAGPAGPTGDAATAYTNASPTPVTIGGIPAGSTFDAVTLNSVIDTLLYPYQAPGFSSFTFIGIATPLEVGDTLPASRTFTWGMSNTANVVGASGVLTLFDGSTIIGLGTSGPAVTTSAAETLTSSGTRTASISATNTRAGTFSASVSVQWQWRRFSGSSSDAALAAAVGTGALATGASGTYSYGAAAGTYKYIMYPASFGTLSTFKDQSTNLDIPFATAYTTPITNAFGVTTSYRVHRSLNQLGGAINIVAS